MSVRSLVRKVCAIGFSLTLDTPAQATVIDAYFGMNFVAAGFSGGSVNIDLSLVDITYIGGGGSLHTTAMPVFPGTDAVGNAWAGLPDATGFTGVPTYTTTAGGDGETTRTIGESVPIDWDTSGAIPTIGITRITVNSSAIFGIWEASFSTPYTVGLIPLGIDTELASSLASPQGDIYDSLAGAAGNPVMTAVATATPPEMTQFLNGSFGEFIFSAAVAPVPLPAAVWLFGAGLIALVGIARRKALFR